MDLDEVTEEHAHIDGRLQFEYEAVIGIPSAEFRRILSELIRRGDKKGIIFNLFCMVTFDENFFSTVQLLIESSHSQLLYL